MSSCVCVCVGLWILNMCVWIKMHQFKVCKCRFGLFACTQLFFFFIYKSISSLFVLLLFFLSPCTSKDIIYTCYWAGRISVWTKSVQNRHCKMKDWGPFTQGPRPRPNISSPPCLSYEIRPTHFQNRCWFGWFPCQQSFCLVVYHACVCVSFE